MRWDLVNQIVESYSGKNLVEDIKLASIQAVVDRSQTKQEALVILGVPQTTLDSWFRKGWVRKPERFSKRCGRFKKGEVRDPVTEAKRLEGLRNYFLNKKSNAGP